VEEGIKYGKSTSQHLTWFMIAKKTRCQNLFDYPCLIFLFMWIILLVCVSICSLKTNEALGYQDAHAEKMCCHKEQYHAVIFQGAQDKTNNTVMGNPGLFAEN